MSNQYKDQSGLNYTTPDNKPAQAGTQVKYYENGQEKTGTFSGGYVQKNK